jgi:signal transduction histidine kinase
VEIYARIVDENATRQAFQPTLFTHLIRSEHFTTSEPFLAISVQDNGPGIPEGDLTRVFEPDFTTKSPEKGAGHGLAIVKRLILQAGGALHLFSHAREGAVFTIYLPIHKG